jgi:phage internal scaffolding protein
MKMRKIFVRSAYNYDVDEASVEAALTCNDESLAIQSAEEESNINTIVRRFGLTGELPNDIKMPQSGDFTNIPDFHTAMNLVRKSQEEFLRVPAEVRARFGNDPQAFMNFIDDNGNYEEAKRLGLLKEPVQPSEPMAVRVVNDPTSST